MKIERDRLLEELRRHDPVGPGDLEGSAGSDAATEMMRRIVATDPEGAPSGGEDRRAGADGARRGWRRRPGPAVLVPIGFAAAIVVVALLIGGSDGGGNGNGVRGADPVATVLDRAAAVAGSQPAGIPARPWSYLKTRETSVSTVGAKARMWQVAQVTTREEWVPPVGAGRMRIVAGPSRFVGWNDRTEWEEAGRPGFLALGFGPRTEVHWIAGDAIRGRVEDLPTDPARLALRLRREASAEQTELPLPAATLQLIAEDLRSPAASPALRKALYEAAKEVPGVRYFGQRAGAERKVGLAIGVSGLGPDGKAQFALIFDPKTARPLATVAIVPTGYGAGPTVRRATVYLEAPPVEPPGGRTL